ncbi:MAG: caspase family protein [Fimbriimonadaceae bacterium]|nr:caspase family protein [Fimbriimonadaceae bacterium]
MGRQTLTNVGRHVMTWGLAALLFAASFGLSETKKSEESRLRLVPIVSDQRLEDIQESPDGTRLITHDRGFAPRLWEPKSMRMLGVLGGHPLFPIQRAEMSWDGSRIITRSRDMVRLWDSRSAKLIAEWSADVKAGQYFSEARISRDNGFVVIGGELGEVWTAETKAGSKIALLGKHGEASEDKQPFVRDINISNDGKRVASCCNGTSLIVWEVVGRKPVREFAGPQEGSGWIELSHDSKQVLVTGLDNKAYLWSVDTGEKQQEWEHIIGNKGFMPNTLMAAIFVGKSFDEVLVAGPTGTMTIYDRKSGTLLRKLIGYKGAVREIRKSRDGLKVATYADEEYSKTNEPLKVWDVPSAKEHPFTRGVGGPTAGEFSPDARYFWVGYEDGSIRRHQLSDGSIHTETIGSVQAFEGFYPLGVSGRFYYSRPSYGRLGVERRFTLFDPQNPTGSVVYQVDGRHLLCSDTGRLALGRAYYKDEDGKDKVTKAIWDVTTDKLVWGFQDSFEGVVWGGKEELLGWTDTEVLHFDMAGPSYVATPFATSSAKMALAWMSQDNRWGVALDSELGLHVFGLNGNAQKYDLGKTDSALREQIAISPDSKRLVHMVGGSYVVVDLESGKALATIPMAKAKYKDEERSLIDQIAFGPDSQTLIVGGYGQFVFIDAVSGKQRFSLSCESSLNGQSIASRISPDGKVFVATDTRSVTLHSMSEGKPVARIDLTDTISSLAYTLDSKRLIISDATEQATIWDATQFVPGNGPESPMTYRKLGSFVVMRDQSWLAMDGNGRYDASDPSNVTGASYVLEWEGGLEPIEVSQLKSLYYEPGLLAKLLGTNDEPLRSVPNLANVRLYPEIKLTPSERNPNRVEVALTERDGGGIGTVHVLINGKEVMKKEGTGFFNVDTSDYAQYFLPAARLVEGRGNLLQVYATNKSGDLTSRAEVVDLGIPKGLQTPDVNLYGLFVGVSDYVGNKRDLKAPASDAEKLGEAVLKTGGRLLPKRVHVTELTTDNENPELRPTRQAILGWFDAIAKKATSSDIIVVFFAGHGTSAIGGQRGYFFLTADADPSEVTASIIGTSTITGDDLQKKLAAIPASKQVIILDTCHSGAAASTLLQSDRSVSSDFARAYESIKDGSGTWLLAGAAADQLSYESNNVEHGMLTYSLLEAINKASSDGLRSASGGDLFVDVERWLSYAAGRVDSLKNEVGISGIQRPEFKRSRSGGSFDIGVTRPEFRGELGLKPPLPVVIMGTFDEDEVDPLGLENAIVGVMRESQAVKLWTDITKHPNVYRIAGTYSRNNDTKVVKLRLVVQKFDSQQSRKNLKTIEIEGLSDRMPELAKLVRERVEETIRELEKK